MDKKVQPVDIIDLLAFQEYKLAVLYNLFAATYSECTQLWAGLAVDELEHQRLIRGFKPLIDGGSLYFNAMISKVEFIEGHIKTIEGLISRFESNPVDIKEALQIALNIENSMLDQDLFAYFFGDSEALKSGLDFLTRDTQQHYNALLMAAQKTGAV